MSTPHPPHPPSTIKNKFPSSTKQNEEQETIQEEVFQRMMTRMMNGTGLDKDSNSNQKSNGNNYFASTSRPGKKNSISFDASLNNNNKSNPRSSKRKAAGGNNNNMGASTIEELPALIASLRGALTPRNITTSFEENNINNRTVASPKSASSVNTTMGQSKMFLQYEQQREQDDRVEEAKKASSFGAGGGAASNRNKQQTSSSTSPSRRKSVVLNETLDAVEDSNSHNNNNNNSNMMKAVSANIRQSVANNNNNMEASSSSANGNSTAVHEIENRIFGGGPVPASLRTVVAEIKDQIAARLKLSDVGSFRTCVQALFECRSIIDQVLKQTPNHWHFRDETFGMTSDEENVALNQFEKDRQLQQRRQDTIIRQAAQQKFLSEMMDDCRKSAQVVQIPQGGYFLDGERGTIGVGITGNVAMGDIQNQQHKMLNASVGVVRGGGVSGVKNNMNSGNSRRPSLQLSSSFVVANAPEQQNAANSTTITNSTSSQYYNKNMILPKDNVVNGYFSPIPPNADFAGRSLKDPATANSHSVRNFGQQQQENNNSAAGGTLANVLRLLDPENDHQLVLKFLRKQSQQATSGTQTEEKMKDELSKEDFAFQERKVRELEVLVKEYEGTTQRLRNQLRIAQGALATRSGTVTYIRETLLKETSILKTQLQVLQQYQLANTNNNNFNTTATAPSTGGGGGNNNNNAMMSSNITNSYYVTAPTPLNGNRNPTLISPSVGASTTGLIQVLGHSVNVNNNTAASMNINRSFASMSQFNNNNNNSSITNNTNFAPVQGLPAFLRPNLSSVAPGGMSVTNNFLGVPANITNHNSNNNNYINNNHDDFYNNQETLNSNNNNNKNTNSRPPPLSTLALQPLAPIYSLLDTILCAVENEEVLERQHQNNYSSSPSPSSPFEAVSNANNANGETSNDSFVTGPSKDSQLRELKGLFAHQQAHWKRETADARSRFTLALKRKNDQLRKVTLASDVVYLRETLLKMFSDFKDSFADFKASVKSSMKIHSNFMQRTSRDLEFGIARASAELENHHQLVKERDALRNVIFAVPDLIVPSLAPEFAMGYHSWSYADSTEPLKSYASAHFSSDIVESMSDELGVLHDLFVEVQRFGVRVHQLPDVHRPKPGWLLSRVAQGLLRSPACTNELAMQIRGHLEKDDALAKQQAKVNIAIHGVIIRRKVLADRIRAALREGGVAGCENLSDEATLSDLTNSSPWDRSNKAVTTRRIAAMNATFADIPTCVSRFNEFSEDIDTYHIKRMKLQQQRVDNARALFHLWRNSGVDVTGGRFAIVSRDPDAPWTSGLVKTRRLKGNNNNNFNPAASSNSTTMFAGASSMNNIFDANNGNHASGRSNNNHNAASMNASGRYGSSTGTTSPSRILSGSNNTQPRQRVVSVMDE